MNINLLSDDIKYLEKNKHKSVCKLTKSPIPYGQPCWVFSKKTHIKRSFKCSDQAGLEKIISSNIGKSIKIYYEDFDKISQPYSLHDLINKQLQSWLKLSISNVNSFTINFNSKFIFYISGIIRVSSDNLTNNYLSKLRRNSPYLHVPSYSPISREEISNKNLKTKLNNIFNFIREHQAKFDFVSLYTHSFSSNRLLAKNLQEINSKTNSELIKLVQENIKSFFRYQTNRMCKPQENSAESFNEEIYREVLNETPFLVD